MGFAEQKIELFKIIADADEIATGKLIEFAQQLNLGQQKFTQDELERFHASREKYRDAANHKTILLEDAHAYIRNLKKK